MLSTPVLALTPDCARCRGIAPAAPAWTLHINPHGGFGANYDGQVVLDLIAAVHAWEREFRPALSGIKPVCVCALNVCEIVHIWDFGLLVIVWGMHHYVEIPAADIKKWLDEWTPWWKLSRRPAVDAADAAPTDDGV